MATYPYFSITFKTIGQVSKLPKYNPENPWKKEFCNVRGTAIFVINICRILAIDIGLSQFRDHSIMMSAFLKAIWDKKMST